MLKKNPTTRLIKEYDEKVVESKKNEIVSTLQSLKSAQKGALAGIKKSEIDKQIIEVQSINTKNVCNGTVLNQEIASKLTKAENTLNQYDNQLDDCPEGCKSKLRSNIRIIKEFCSKEGTQPQKTQDDKSKTNQTTGQNSDLNMTTSSQQQNNTSDQQQWLDKQATELSTSTDIDKKRFEPFTKIPNYEQGHIVVRQKDDSSVIMSAKNINLFPDGRYLVWYNKKDWEQNKGNVTQYLENGNIVKLNKERTNYDFLGNWLQGTTQQQNKSGGEDNNCGNKTPYQAITDMGMNFRDVQLKWANANCNGTTPCVKGSAKTNINLKNAVCSGSWSPDGGSNTSGGGGDESTSNDEVIDDGTWGGDIY